MTLNNTLDINRVAEEALIRHRVAFPDRHIEAEERALESGGVYQWRSDGEYHLFNPETIHLLQKSVRTGSYEVYKQYAQKINDQSENLSTLRGLMRFKNKRKPVPIEEVETVQAITRRSRISLGKISLPKS